jgi:hypothetical protein
MELLFYSPTMADNSDFYNKENWHFFAGETMFSTA